jgi:hypothetical protein
MNTEKQLKRAYKKRLNTINKNFFDYSSSGLEAFIEYLKYKRDTLILRSGDEDVITLLTAMIAEFEASQASEEYEKKEFHWNSFCDFLKLFMED